MHRATWKILATCVVGASFSQPLLAQGSLTYEGIDRTALEDSRRDLDRTLEELRNNQELGRMNFLLAIGQIMSGVESGRLSEQDVMEIWPQAVRDRLIERDMAISEMGDLLIQLAAGNSEEVNMILGGTFGVMAALAENDESLGGRRAAQELLIEQCRFSRAAEFAKDLVMDLCNLPE